MTPKEKKEYLERLEARTIEAEKDSSDAEIAVNRMEVELRKAKEAKISAHLKVLTLKNMIILALKDKGENQ